MKNIQEREISFAHPAQDREAIHSIWGACFGDSAADIDFYIKHRMNDKNMLVLRQAGRAVAMASLLPVLLHTEAGPLDSLYVYAVATLPEYQGRGFSSRLLAYAQQHWQRPLLLSPSEESLQEFYARSGFRLVYNSCQFCLQEDSAAATEQLRPQIRPASPEEYLAIRDRHWQGPGYAAWGAEAIDYAMKLTEYCNGEGLLLTWQQEGPRQDILMYTLQGAALRIVETTLELQQLQSLLPLLREQVKGRRPQLPALQSFIYQLPAGMLWLPEGSRACPLPGEGYFNLVLD